MPFPLRLSAPRFASPFLLSLLVGAPLLLAPLSARASTTIGFSAADSATQDYYGSDDQTGDTAAVHFTLHGGSANVGLTLGVAKTIHVGSGALSGGAEGDADAGATGAPLPHSLSLTGTSGTVTQILSQTDSPEAYSDANGNSVLTVSIPAGPTVTYELGAQGRVDVTPQAYSYTTSSASSGPGFPYTLLLRAPAVPPSGITVSPSSVTYPAPATGTLTLTKPAADAQVVLLASSNPAAVGVPATLSFAAGQQTATFPIATYRVDADTTVTLSAKAGGTTKTVAFTVKTRPETAFTYTIAGFEDTDNEDNASASISVSGGSGTVKLAQEIPYTVNIGTYNTDASAGYLDSAGVGGTMARAVKLDSQMQALLQGYSVTISVDSEDDESLDASVDDSQTLLYDLGSKGRVELKAIGHPDSGNAFSAPVQYTFLLHAPNKASSLLISPGKVYGGAPTYGRITLAAVAGTGGQTVTLKASDPTLMGVSASVVVPEGVKSAVFPIYTQEPDEDTPVTLTATSGGTSKTATLTLLARYQFSGTVKSGSAGLSGVTVGASSTGSFTLTNTVSPNAAIPDNSAAGLSTTLKSSGTGTITGLVVGVNITHSYIGDLRVTLKGPDGTTAILYDRSGGNQKNIVASYPVLRTPVDSLSAFNGKQVAGTWTLLVQDLAALDVGTLNGWNLTFTYQGTVTGLGGTSSDGTYVVSDLKEGTYTATPTKSGASFTPTSRSVAVGPNVVDPNPDGIDFAKK